MLSDFSKDERWKNFELGVELDISGSFIYNGIKIFNDLESLNNAAEIFEVLYNISVGLERLLKIAIILVEHNDETNLQEFEKNLITHNTLKLHDRLNKSIDLNLPAYSKEFLALLSEFYKTYRYIRFSKNSITNSSAEKYSFLKFIEKHLKTKLIFRDDFILIENTDQIKIFLGKVIKKITDKSFLVIRNKAMDLNIFTYELRTLSKAHRVFWGEKLDFIAERLCKKEMILYLMSNKITSPHLEMLRNYDPLLLESDLTAVFIKCLLSDFQLQFAKGFIEVGYDDHPNVKDRIKFLENM
ncbi:MAG TPA: hypothetical protein PLX69_24700 [Leptospiraceae bacterium]|nr:hypothetical protein [Leptospiraceae bacterium]